MARRPRIVIPHVPQHVVVRGNNRRRLFSFASDYLRFLRYLSLASTREAVDVHALTLMSNHVHLVVTPKKKTALSRFVKSFAQRYAQTRNRDRECSGKLFEQRFWSQLILTPRQLAVTCAYVELNPVRAGRVRLPEAYAWSTYALHTGRRSKIPADLWRPCAWYRGLAPTTAGRATAYAAWVKQCRARDTRPEAPEILDVIEELSARRYTRRLRRPDEKRAS